MAKKGKSKNQDRLIFTKETLGVVMLLFATLCLVFLITGDAIMYPVGGIVKGFLFGCFGYFAYAVLIYGAFKGILLVTGKEIGYSKKFKALITCAFVFLAILCQVISMKDYSDYSFGDYIVKAFMIAQGENPSSTASGFVVAIISYGFSTLLTNLGSYVVLGVLLALSTYGTINLYLKEHAQKVAKSLVKFRSSVVQPDDQVNSDLEIKGIKEYPVDIIASGDCKPKQKLFITDADDSAFKPKRKNIEDAQIKIEYTSGGLGVGVSNNSYSKTYTNELESKLEYIKTPAKIDLNANYNPTPIKNQYENTTRVSDYISIKDNSPITPSVTEKENIPFFEHNESEDTAESRAREFSRDYLEESYSSSQEVEEIPFVEESIQTEEVVSEQINPEPIQEIKRDRSNIFGFTVPEQPKEDSTEKNEEELPPSRIVGDRRSRGLLFEENNDKEDEETAYTSRVNIDDNSSRRGAFDGAVSRRGLANDLQPKTFIEEEPPKKPQPPINREYFRPPLDLLQTYAPPTEQDQENHAERMEIIKQTLEDFHIPSEPQSFVKGPSITRYEIRIPTGKGISVKKVLNYDDDLKMRLACKDGVRIEAPIPGKDLVGVEVANKVKITVGLKEVLELAAQKEKPNPNALMFALGKDIVGNAITDNLAKGPHYLVAGATGSGKSVCLNTMIVSLVMRYSPEDLRLILIDPKSVEFAVYEHLPHLMIDEIITNSKRAIAALAWAYEEMERRFRTFKECGQFVVDIDSYNNVVASDTVPKMPRIVIIIDELADLMQTCKKDLEARICAIAQKARSAGIHLVLATQRPSVDVITGTIKANLPSRIAFKVTNYQDSQTILAEQGAEKLLGNGDMLYKNSVMPDMGRYQGAFITAKEVNNVCTYIREHNQCYFNDDLMEYLDKATKPAQEESSMEEYGDNGGNTEVSPMFLRALWLAVNVGKISISALQRRFQIGYSRAGGIIDKMERMGYISGDEGSKARQVLITRADFEEKYGEPPAEEF